MKQKLVINYTVLINTILPNFPVWKFVERQSFCIVSGNSPETLRKLRLPTNFHDRKLVEITIFYVVLPTTLLLVNPF